MESFETLKVAKVPEDYLSEKLKNFLQENYDPIFKDVETSLEEKMYYTITLEEYDGEENDKELQKEIDDLYQEIKDHDYFLIAKI